MRPPKTGNYFISATELLLYTEILNRQATLTFFCPNIASYCILGFIWRRISKPSIYWGVGVAIPTQSSGTLLLFNLDTPQNLTTLRALCGWHPRGAGMALHKICGAEKPLDTSVLRHTVGGSFARLDRRWGQGGAMGQGSGGGGNKSTSAILGGPARTNLLSPAPGRTTTSAGGRRAKERGPHHRQPAV